MEKCSYETLLEQGRGMIYDRSNFDETHQVCMFSPRED
jgi:hypothetical protein